jgi:hypothetical protein
MECCDLPYLLKNKKGNVRINVTLRRVRVTIVAVKKQLVLHILSVCGLNYPVRMRRIILSSVAYPALFPNYLVNGAIFGKKLLNIK